MWICPDCGATASTASGGITGVICGHPDGSQAEMLSADALMALPPYRRPAPAPARPAGFPAWSRAEAARAARRIREGYRQFPLTVVCDDPASWSRP